jgi:hypothetical protein
MFNEIDIDIREDEWQNDAYEDYAFEKSLRDDYENCEEVFSEQIDEAVDSVKQLVANFAEYGWKFDINEYL